MRHAGGFVPGLAMDCLLSVPWFGNAEPMYAPAALIRA